MIGATTLHAIPGLPLRRIKAMSVPTRNVCLDAEFVDSWLASAQPVAGTSTTFS
jgi:hypothetical protein